MESEPSISDASENGNDGAWINAGKSRKRKIRKQSDDCSSSSESGSGGSVVWRQVKFLGVIQLDQNGASFATWNPIVLARDLSKAIREVKEVKVLRNGNLLVECKSAGQLDALLAIDRLGQKAVKCTVFNQFSKVKGVISPVSKELTEDEIKKNIKGCDVLEVKRLKSTRGGVKSDSLAVLLTMKGSKLPGKVFVGFNGLSVREFIPPPLRCFRCQKFGHVAAVCKGKQTCGRCSGEHEYGKCQEGAKIKCANCGGDHTAAYGGCEVSREAVSVQKVKADHHVSYAEAVKKIRAVQNAPVMTVQDNRHPTVQTIPLLRERDREARDGRKAKECKECKELTKDTLLIKKEDFLAFIIESINCSAQTSSKTEKIKIILSAAEKYLDITGFPVEMMVKRLAGGSGAAAV